MQHQFDFSIQTQNTLSIFAFSTSYIQISIIAIQLFLFSPLSFFELCRINYDWSCNTFLLFVIFKQKNPTENGYQLYEEAFIPAE